MDIRGLQAALNSLGANPRLNTDGDLGKKTLRAVDLELKEAALPTAKWGDEQRFVAVEQLLFKSLDIEVGKIDGRVGPQTLYARDVYAARLRGDKSAETWRDKEVDKPVPPPIKGSAWPRQIDVERFFGKPGERLVAFKTPYPLLLAWDLDVTVNSFQCHELVRAPLERIFAGTLKHYGPEGIADLRLNRFGGCFNIRKMRGGSSLSMHSWGIAVDMDPERNQLKWGRDKATLDDPAYDEWWALWEAEGAVSLGRARNYDWMHAQFART